MIAYMIKIGSLAGRLLCHSLDREHLHGGSSFIKICMMCGIFLGTKSPSCYILDQFGYTKLFVLFNLVVNYLMNRFGCITMLLIQFG